jgi:hypothetical protein
MGLGGIAMAAASPHVRAEDLQPYVLRAFRPDNLLRPLLASRSLVRHFAEIDIFAAFGEVPLPLRTADILLLEGHGQNYLPRFAVLGVPSGYAFFCAHVCVEYCV